MHRTLVSLQGELLLEVTAIVRAVKVAVDFRLRNRRIDKSYVHGFRQSFYIMFLVHIDKRDKFHERQSFVKTGSMQVVATAKAEAERRCRRQQGALIK